MGLKLCRWGRRAGWLSFFREVRRQSGAGEHKTKRLCQPIAAECAKAWLLLCFREASGKSEFTEELRLMEIRLRRLNGAPG